MIMKYISKYVEKMLNQNNVLQRSLELNLRHQLMKRSTDEGVEFVIKNMPKALIFETREAILDFALKQVKVDGLYLEFGVWKGESINHISSKTENIVFGFDSFLGFKKEWGGSSIDKDYFKLDTKPVLNQNVQIIDGWFEDTLPEFFNIHDEKIAFIHIDCDTYDSTRTVFDCLAGKIQKDTIIQFDEFLCHFRWQENEYKAFMEFVESNGIKFDYLAVDRQGRVTVQIK